jgi:hypothetical protein
MTCANCGISFKALSTQPHRKYCCIKCRELASGRRYRARKKDVLENG